jgi:hypothetical protein
MNSLFNKLNLPQKRLIVLLQIGLWGKSDNSRIFEGVSYHDWKKIMELSAIQGVYAIVYDGIQRLAAEYRPPRDLLIEWGIGIKQIEKRYFQQKQALQDLTTLFKKNNVRCILLKGIGYSHYYPVPEHRESGDWDMYLFGDYEKGNRILEQSGIQVERPATGYVHSSFEFQGIKVENHRSFLALDWQKDDFNFEEVLQQKLREESPLYCEDPGIYVPCQAFNLLYAYKHALKHFIAEGVVLRQLCDLAQILKQIKDPELYQSFYETMKKYGLHHYVGAFNLLIDNVLGLSLEKYLYDEKSVSFSHLILKDIFLKSRPGPQLPRSGFFQLVKVKFLGAMDFYKKRWKYQAVNDKMFQQELGLRLKISLLHFKELKKIKGSKVV